MAPRSKLKPKPEGQKYWTLLVVTVIPVCTWIGGNLTTAWTYIDKVATKSLLEERLAEVRLYTDEKMRQGLQTSLEHDEKNRAELAGRFESTLNELKVRNAIVDTKIETLLRATSEIKDMANENKNRKR